MKNKSEEQEKREETGFYYSFASQFFFCGAPHFLNLDQARLIKDFDFYHHLHGRFALLELKLTREPRRG